MVAAAQTRDSTKAMGMTGVVEYADPMNEVGYTIMDVSGDGIPELIVAPTSPEESSVVLSLYTLANGAPQFVLEGFARSRYVYHGENHFTYGASGGMNISGCGEFTLSEDGTAPVWSRFLFTDPNPVDGMFVFSNTTGSWDIASSEPYSDNLDDYVAVSSELANIPVVGLNVTPFSNYR